MRMAGFLYEMKRQKVRFKGERMYVTVPACFFKSVEVKCHQWQYVYPNFEYDFMGFYGLHLHYAKHEFGDT